MSEKNTLLNALYRKKYRIPSTRIPGFDYRNSGSYFVTICTKDARKMSDISPRSGSLSAIIRSYKSAVTRRVHQSGITNFAWQPRFYEHIIRTEDSFERISDYIKTNPEFWRYDIEKPNEISIDKNKLFWKKRYRSASKQLK